MKKKIDLMHQQFGRCEGHVCKACTNFVKGRYHDRTLRKCQVYGLTHSEASDWAGKWPACGMFNREYSGRPIIELRRGISKPPAEPLENQIALFGAEPQKEEVTTMEKTESALGLVRAERQRQNSLWGDQSRNHPFEWMSILGEEYGELCEAVNETCFSNATHPERGGYEKIMQEATQVAAVAVAIVEAMQAQGGKEEATGV